MDYFIKLIWIRMTIVIRIDYAQTGNCILPLLLSLQHQATSIETYFSHQLATAFQTENPLNS